MTGEAWNLFLVLLGNSAFSLSAGLAGAIRRDARVVCAGVISLFCPVVGPAIFIGNAIFQRLFRNKVLDQEGAKGAKREKFLFSPSKDEDALVPMEESLLVSSYKDRRKALLKAIRGDIDMNGALFSKALENDDPETSHYSATVILEMTARYQSSLQRASVEYDKDRTRGDVSIAYANLVYDYYTSGILSDIELKKYGYQFIHLLENLEKHSPLEMTPELFKMAVKVMLEMGELRSASHWADRGCERFPLREDMHLSRIKACYAQGDVKGVFNALDALVEANIPLSQEGMAIVRYFHANESVGDLSGREAQ